MNTPVFERLLYTDCRAGAGRRGGNGFQVQAQSAGVDPAQEAMAVRELTYSVQEVWIGEGRPVVDFPLGFAHATDAGYGTAQSRYLGREATGGRQGNHLADCLLTRDAEPYGAIRPAQLWQSDFWRQAPWDSTDCPAYDDFLEPGPLDNEAVADWLRSEPGRARTLERLVSVLEDPGGPKVVIVADEPDEALAWIAAGTLLLPMRTALAISFKVFVSNLYQANHRIRVVPRSLNRSLAQGGGSGWFHVDAGTAVTDEYEVSPRAAFWVGQLVAADDPYQVVDAVETADALGDADGSRADARLVAWAVTMPADPVPNSAALSRWLTGASPAELARHGTAVAERLLECTPDAPTLRWIDAAAASGHIAVDRVAVRSALVVAEVEEARTGIPRDLGPLSRVEIGADACRDAESLTGSAILLAADDAGVAALLRVARRHSVALPLDALQERLHAFAARWLAGHDVDYRPGEWALEEPILDIVHQQLTHALPDHVDGTVSAVIRQVWPALIDRSCDPNEPLNWQLHAAAVAAAAPDERSARVRAAFDGLRRNRCRPSSTAGLQQAMVDWRVVGGREALLVVTLVPTELPLHPDIEVLAVRTAERGCERPDGAILSAVNLLNRRGLPLPDALMRLHRADARMAQIAAIAQIAATEADGDRLTGALDRARDIPVPVALTWVSPLVRASLASRAVWLGAVFLGHLVEEVASRFLTRWALELPTETGAAAAAYGICWYLDRDCPEALRPSFARLFSQHLDQLAADSRHQFVAEVRRRCGTEEHALAWDSLAGEDRGRQRRFGFSRDKNR